MLTYRCISLLSPRNLSHTYQKAEVGSLNIESSQDG